MSKGLGDENCTPESSNGTPSIDNNNYNSDKTLQQSIAKMKNIDEKDDREQNDLGTVMAHGSPVAKLPSKTSILQSSNNSKMIDHVVGGLDESNGDMEAVVIDAVAVARTSATSTELSLASSEVRIGMVTCS